MFWEVQTRINQKGRNGRFREENWGVEENYGVVERNR